MDGQRPQGPRLDVGRAAGPAAPLEHGGLVLDPGRAPDTGGAAPSDVPTDTVRHHLEHARPARGRDRDTRERTRDLLNRVVDADPQERQLIRDEVISLHLWLADRAARRYGPRSELDDLVQETLVKVLTAHKSGTPPTLSVLLSTDMFTLIDEDAIVPLEVSNILWEH